MKLGLGILMLAVLAMPCLMKGQEEIDRTFMRRYNYGGMQGGLALTTTEDGGFVATGQHEGNGSAGGCDVYVYRVDACGNNVWFRLFGTSNSEGGKSIEATPDGGFIIGGHGSSGLLLKLNSEGEAEWYHHYNALDWIFDAIPTEDGGYAAIGRQSGEPVLLKVDADGLVEWAMRYTGFHEMPLSLSQLDNGDFLFVANQVGVGRDVDVGRVDNDGEAVWMKRYGGGFNDFDHTTWGCNALLDDDGNAVYVTAPTTLGSMAGENILLMKLDLADGEPIWSKSFGSDGGDQSRDMTLTSTGIAVVGNTNGFPQATSTNPDMLEQNMAERDVLMFHLDSDGNVDWAQTYGGNERDKGIGVRYDELDGFTISAYTSSSVFGNEDGSMDPLFIRTDSVGQINCQSAPVLIEVEDVDVNPMLAGSAASISVTASGISPTFNEIQPNDVYQCQACYTEPLFEWSTNQVCVGNPVEFYNTTEVGLICFQEWELEGPEVPGGIVFPGGTDTISYVFNTPGDYTMTLRSTCDSSDEYFIIPLFVHEVYLDEVLLSDFNGYEVSCPGSENGTAEGQASGGSSPGNYAWEWTLDGVLLATDEEHVDALHAGDLQAVVMDYLGCSDTLVVELQEPPELSVEAMPFNQYNGYGVSCPDASDGMLEVVSVQGGVGGYSSQIVMANGDLHPITNLPPGSFALEVEDANGCTAWDSVQLMAPPPPSVQLTSRLDSCETGNGGLEAVYSCGVPPCSLLWPVEQGVSTIINPFSQRLDDLSAGTYQVSVMDGNGCVETGEIMVEQTVMPQPQLMVDPLSGCLPDLEVTVEERGADEVVQRIYDFGEGDPEITFGDEGHTVRQQSHIYTQPGDYLIQVQVLNTDGCVDQIESQVTVQEGLAIFAPNAFTPGNDGFNDGWRPVGSGIETYHLIISDRWGETLFETDDPHRWWNGSPRGDGLSHINDLFVYMIEATGLCDDYERLMGTVMLVR
ncbi:gliding motility-associated C-terminal domain-containing protein [Flavobacteriales bacterium]|nr:gliding motility-associated C-terminal domain-containing protein [Flavobacteriales bacterium]